MKHHNISKKAALLLALVMLFSLLIPEAAMAAPSYTAGDVFVTNVKDGYLALRSLPCYDDANIISKLYNGDRVELIDMSYTTYWTVYSYKDGKTGYINKDCLDYYSSKSDKYTAKVDSGYLCLRSEAAYNSSNVIGQIYSGTQVNVLTYGNGDYWYVYVPTLAKKGYVNKGYLHSSSSSGKSGESYSVKVDSGYLALRSSAADGNSNIIGELYTGQTVNVLSKGSGTYWYVYAPTLKKEGYVNKNCLTSGSSSGGSSSSSKSGPSYKVIVSSGYLALRSSAADGSSNIIGELYPGNTVNVVSKDSGTYWYVYAPSLNKSGYVNKKYLASASSSGKTTYSVKVKSGYLALRSKAVYDDSNIIAQLYTGDKVEYISTYDSTYWYVYSSKYGYGYVNKGCLE